MKIKSTYLFPFLLTILSFAALPELCQGQTASATGVVSNRTSNAGRDEITRPRVIDRSDSRRDSSVRGYSTSRGISSSASLERRVFELINAKRAERGLKSLSWNSKVAGVARGHSKEMALYDYFSHTDVDGRLVDGRAVSAGLNKWRAIGENIAYLRGYEDPAQYAVEKWMLSPSHRDNLLDPRWQETGIGLVIASDGTYFFTQVFMTD